MDSTNKSKTVVDYVWDGVSIPCVFTTYLFLKRCGYNNNASMQIVLSKQRPGIGDAFQGGQMAALSFRV